MIPHDDLQPAVGQTAGDEQGMFVLNHILRSHNDQCGNGEGGQLLGPDMGFLDHQAQNLRAELRLQTSAGKEGGQMIAQYNGYLQMELHTRGGQVGSVEDQPVHPFRMGQGEGQGDVSPVAEPQYIGALNLLLVQEVQQVLGKLGHGEGGLAPGGLSMAPGVDGIDRVVEGKGPHLVDKIGTVLPVAVEEEQGRPAALLDIAHGDVRHRGLLSPACL